MLDFNNAGPQHPHTGYFGATANDQAWQASGGGLPPRPVAPDDYHMPPDIPAIAELCALKSWVCWAYALNKTRTKWTKEPKQPWQPRVNASTSDARTWGDFGQAVKAAMGTSGIDGIGFVFTSNDELVGFDLDGVRDPATGKVEPWAQEIIELSETYAELSPSGRGFHIIARGKLEGGGISHQPSQVEMYDRGRYFTFSGHHVLGTPAEIKPAPRTMEALQARVQAFKQEAREKAKKEQDDQHGGSQHGAHASNDSFFRRVNDAALRDLETVGRWFKRIFPGAYQSANGSWRASSEETGRAYQYEEDLTIGMNPATGQLGIVDRAVHDMGDPREGRRTPIDLVLEWVPAESLPKPLIPNQPLRAAHWLCEVMDRDPAEFGWKDGRASADREGPAAKEHPPLQMWSGADWKGHEIPPLEWIVPGIIPAGTVTMLSGDGGVGKSLIACQLATCAATGKFWLGKEVRRTGTVLYVSAEDDRDELHRRMDKMLGHYDLSYDQIADLHFVELVGEGALLAAPDRSDGIIRRTIRFAQIETEVARLKPVLVVLDTLANLFAGNENDRTQVGQFISLLRAVTVDYKTTVVLLAHPSQSGLNSGSGTSGSTGWRNSVRSFIYLERMLTPSPDDSRRMIEADEAVRLLTVKKSNRASLGEPLLVRWQDGVFMANGTGTAEDLKARDMECDLEFLRLLELHEQHNIRVSHNGPNQAPKLFQDHAENKRRFTKRQFKASMDRLLTGGRIFNVESGPPSKRRCHLSSNPPDQER
jgi:RecA-family ATPase